MESKTQPNPIHAAMKQSLIQMITAMAAYAVLLILSILLIKANPDAWWRFPVALLPVLPTIFGVMAYLRALRAMDELQQRIQLEALAFSVGCTGSLTFTYGFLENVGFPTLSWVYIFPMLAAFWGIGLALTSRRYR